MTAPVVPTGRNLFSSPTSLGTGWSGSGSGAAGGNAAAAFTGAVAITGMDRDVAGRLVQGGLTANGRISVEPYVSTTDLDGLPFSASVQIEADPVSTRCTNPVYVTTTPAWLGTGGATASAATGLTGMVATTAYRIAKASAAGTMFAFSEAVACTPGEVVTGCLQARPSAATTLTWYIGWFNSAGTQIATTTGVAVSAAAGSTTNRAVSGAAPANAVTCRVAVGTASVAVGVTLTVTGARIDGVADPSASDGTGGMLYGATVSCALELNFRDASGVRLGATVTGTSVAIASGGSPARVYATGTAPTGTRRVEAVPLYRSLAARQRVFATLARADQVSDAALVGADGATAGWGWDGAAGLSTSGPAEDGENYSLNPEARSDQAGVGTWAASGAANGAVSTYVTGVTGLTCTTALRCVQGTVTANHWAYAPIHDPGRDMSGETWTVVLEGLESAAVSASVQLYYYDSAGVSLGQVTGTAVSVAAGGVIRQVVTATLPAGTRSIRAALISRSLPAGATVTVTAARYRRGSWPSLVFASGASRAWAWDLRPGSTSRRLLTEWIAATDGTTAASVGTSIGYTGTQYQPGPPAGSSTTQPIQNGGTPIPVEAAPGGRPGRATRTTIADNVQRYEHRPNHRSFDIGDDVFFGFSFYLGTDFPLDTSGWQIIEQLHQAWGSWSPPVAFEPRLGGLYVTGGNGLPNGSSNPTEYAHSQRIADLQRQRWYSLVYRVEHFSDQVNTSKLCVWLDGALLLERWTIPCPTIVQGDAADRLTYRKQGLYHHPSIPGGTVWHAGAAMGQGFAAVDPYRQLPSFPQTLTATSRVSTATSGVPALTRGPVSAVLTSRPSIAASGAPSLARGPVTAAATSRPSTATAGRPTLTTGTVTHAPGSRPSAAASGAPALTRGPVARNLAGRPAGATAGRADLLVGPITRSTPGRSSTATSGTPALTVGTPTVRPLGRPSAAVAGLVALARGAVTRSVPGRPAASTAGRAALLVGAVTRALAGRSSAAAAGAPQFGIGPVTRAVPGRASSSATGRPGLFVGPIARTAGTRASARTTGRPTVHVTLLVLGRASTATSGRPALALGAVTRTPAGRPSQQRAGEVTVLVADLRLDVASRPPERDSGTIEVELGAIERTPAPRAPERETGDHELDVGPIARTPSPRARAATAGRPGIALATVIRHPGSAPSRATSGDPALALGPIVRLGRSRPSARTAGRPGLLVGGIERRIAGHPRPDRAGSPTLQLGALLVHPPGAPSARTAGDPLVVRGTAVTARPGRLQVLDKPGGLAVIDEPSPRGLEVVDGW